MKLKKTLACVAAAAVAVSSLALSAFAEATEVKITEKQGFNIAGKELVGGDTLKVTITSLKDGDNFTNGCVGHNSLALIEENGGDTSKGWTQEAWDMQPTADNGSKEITVDINDIPFVNDDAGNPTEVREDVQVQVWWYDGDVSVTYEVVAAATPGMTELPDDAYRVKLTSTGVVTAEGGVYRVNISNPYNDSEEATILDKADLAGAVAIGIHFDVAEFDDYGEAFNVTAITEDTATKQAYWGEGNAANNGVTITPATVDKDGDYIVWVVFDQPIEATENVVLALITDIPEVKTSTNEPGDGVPVITVSEVGVQDGTPAEDNSSEDDTSKDDTSKDDTSKGDTSTPTTGDSKDDGVPDTGVTLAVVPTVLAAAALVGAAVATKKRK